jgi:hypothetical protein
MAIGDRPVNGQPDFTALFPVGVEEDEWYLTPRTAYGLHGRLGLVADFAYDDVKEHGSDPIDDPDDWAALADLPTISWRQDADWRRQVARAADDLCHDVEAGRWPLPRTSAEELCLHLAIQYAEAWEQDQSDDDERLAELPTHPEDFDWEMCSEVLFRDHDILSLYEAHLDGIEDPADEINRSMGMGDLRPRNWHRTFAGAEPRDPRRGFRR